MTIKDDIIKLINAVYRNDCFTNDFTEALRIVFQRLIDFCDAVKDNHFFDKLDETGLIWWEVCLKIIPSATQTLDDRRATVQAKYLSNGHNSIKLIQKICDSWKNGEIEADFVDGKIQIRFVGSFGVPTDLDTLKEAVDEVKTAHLPYLILFKYLLIENIHEIKTLEEMEKITIDSFSSGYEEEKE